MVNLRDESIPPPAKLKELKVRYVEPSPDYTARRWLAMEFLSRNCIYTFKSSAREGICQGKSLEPFREHLLYAY